MTEEQRARILVTDDDSSIRTYVKELLTRQGYAVLLAEDGMQCLELARNEQPDLILMDVFMPEMSGSLAAHRLAENVLTKDIPIIFLTSMINKEQEMVVENLDGSYVFLSKPIDNEKFLAEINRVLQDAAQIP
ncbi:MAG: response regulator [Gammaproteobacteria bacterium]|nr:MAG: response regulator [Gammaproteobacteria bacterium]